MFSGMIGECIRRFELIRRILGHGAVLTDAELAEILRSLNPLAEYFALEQMAFNEAARYDCSPIDPVRPIFDLAAGTVRHATCTGNTELVVQVIGNRATLSMVRRAPLDTRDARKGAMAVLANYRGRSESARQPTGVPDPTYPGSALLETMLGRREADRLIATYHPDWEAWREEGRRLLAALDAAAEAAADADEAARR